MDGKNCSGGKISLLNDRSDVGPLAVEAQHQLPPLPAPYRQPHPHHRASTYSRAFSCKSTASLPPQVPQLVRSDSNDSGVFTTPSPLTLSYHSFDEHAAHPRAYRRVPQQYSIVAPRYGKMDDVTIPMYLMSDATLTAPSCYAGPTQVPSQVIAPPMQPPTRKQLYCSSSSPVSETSCASTVSNGSKKKTRAPSHRKRTSTPALLLSCSTAQTTSPPPAMLPATRRSTPARRMRSAPSAKKAFTRKDNMEQHRRTHQNVRGVSRTSGSSENSKVKKATKPAPKKPTTKLEAAALEAAAVMQQLAEQQPPQVSQVQMSVTQAPMQPLPQSLHKQKTTHPHSSPR